MIRLLIGVGEYAHLIEFLIKFLFENKYNDFYIGTFSILGF